MSENHQLRLQHLYLHQQKHQIPILKLQTGRKKNKDEQSPVEKKSEPVSTSVNFGAKINTISKQNDHFGAVASLFVGDKNILPNVKNKLVDKIESDKGDELGIDPWGMVRISVDNNTISPFMFLKSSQKNNTEISLHELIHYYIDPYLYAGTEQKKGSITITNPQQEKIALDLFTTVQTLYNDALQKGYEIKNGVSVEQNMYEFVATITNQASSEKLKELGLYDGLLTTLKKHIDTITSVEIPYTLNQAA